jgi:FkbM family methyltransferase
MFRRLVKNGLQMTGFYPVARFVTRALSADAKRIFRDELRLFRSFVKPGDLVFDIGVNVGVKSEIFLALGARVVGVEPNPLCKPAIDFQFGSNPRYTLVQKAVGGEIGQATLHFVGTDSTASLRDDWPFVTGSNIERTLTEVTTLDELIATYGIPTLCKIDVEGFERQVISGLTQLLPLLTFEYHLHERAELRACVESLARLGAIEINVNLMDTGDLRYDTWLSPEEFLARTDLPEAADCWVRPKSV